VISGSKKLPCFFKLTFFVFSDPWLKQEKMAAAAAAADFSFFPIGTRAGLA
jgi:hypothetical protein